MATDNTSLGSFQLAGIPPAPRGLPQIEVTFDIDANGILSVSAKDKGTGKEQSIKISAPNKLSKDEIDNLVRKAEEFAEADRQAKELAETANQADNLVYSIEKNLKEHGDKIGEEDRKAIESKAAALREELKSASKSVVSLKKAMDELEKSSYKLAEILYKQSQAGSGQPGAPGAEAGPEAPAGPQAGAGEPEPGQGPVIDAEFKEDK
ncbi:MAG: Chaperone protein DnaK [candidate division TA06 bacterium ADurb.Bin417]|uniref:Chaperone protein DnaK n=1 Tax=candidate division TA06 bacterium ADurb.Bin417 TaxID=1852828 RepID=A0A1V5MB44_UNCT6|nr:MAG: Chaperone protein DnaK [candidate division TA06 bacterium ADurb.Bin417]